MLSSFSSLSISFNERDEYKLVRKKDTVCEPASSPRNFWECKNRDTCFVLQKDFSKSPSKISGLLTTKFPSGLRGALQFVRHPTSTNFPWDGWAVQVADHSPSGLLLFAMESIRIGIAIKLLTVVSIAIELCAVRLWRLSSLLY